MIISSDITNLFPFTAINNRGMFKEFKHNEKSDGGSPLFTLELRQYNQESEIKIQKHEKIMQVIGCIEQNLMVLLTAQKI